MTLFRRNKIYHWQVHRNGKTIRRSTHETDNRRAQVVAKQFLEELRLRKELSSSLPPVTLSEAILSEVERIEADVNPRRAERVRQYLLNFEAWVGRDVALESLAPDTLTQYQRFRITSAARSTVQAEIRAIMRMLRGKPHNVEKPPSTGQGKTTPNRAFTVDELKRIFRVVTGWMRDLCLILLTTGARPAEIVPSLRSEHIALLKTEVDYAAGTITIRTAKQRAGERGEPRVVQVPPATLDACKRQSQDTLGVHVFTAGSRNLAREFRAMLRHAGVSRIDALERKATLHSFRHTYATLAAQIVGMNPHVLQAALGHKTSAMTAKYCHPTAPAIVLDLGFLKETGTEDGR